MEYDPDKMRARFHELQDKRSTILAKSGPLRDERDAFSNDARAKEQALNAKIHKAEEGLADIDRESAMISRALSGQTGAQPAASAK